MIGCLPVLALFALLACVAALVANKRANDAQRQALVERDRSRHLSAGLALDKGFALAEAGNADRGLLWMLEALKTAPDDAADFRKAVRWNLGAWLGQVHNPLKIIDNRGQCNWSAFSQDGKSFATGNCIYLGDPSITIPVSVWDTASGRKRVTLPGAFGPFAIRPDGKAVVAHADPRRLVAIELATGRVLWTTEPLPGRGGDLIDFSTDGSTVFAICYDDKSADAWLVRLDGATGQQRGEPLRGWGRMAVSPGGSLVAAGRTEKGETYIDLVDMASGRRTASWRAGNKTISKLAFSPDEKSLYMSVLEGDLFKGGSHFGQIHVSGTGRATSPVMANTDIAVYAPSADRLVTATDKLLFVRDANGRMRGSGFPTGAGEAELHLYFRPIRTVAPSFGLN